MQVTTDELLGLTQDVEFPDPKEARLPRKLLRVKDLPVADQRVVLKFVDALVSSKLSEAPLRIEFLPPRAFAPNRGFFPSLSLTQAFVDVLLGTDPFFAESKERSL